MHTRVHVRFAFLTDILRSEQVLVISKRMKYIFSTEVLYNRKMPLPQSSLCHGTLLQSGQPDQAGGEHHIHQLHRHKVAS